MSPEQSEPACTGCRPNRTEVGERPRAAGCIRGASFQLGEAQSYAEQHNNMQQGAIPAEFATSEEVSCAEFLLVRGGTMTLQSPYVPAHWEEWTASAKAIHIGEEPCLVQQHAGLRLALREFYAAIFNSF